MARRRMKPDAAHIRAVIFDLDGVIYRGRTAVPGGSDAVAWLRSRGIASYYFTNNSTRSRQSYVELLDGFGIAADADHIVTSASLTAEYLAAKHRNGRATVLVVGEGGLVDELRDAGLRVVRRHAAGPVAAVVVGMDRRFSYAKLYEAQQALRTGVEFVATNRDATYPVEGNVIPGGGSIVAAVATAAEREPVLIGKPSRTSGALIVRHAGVEPQEVLLVGDRLETDIEMGRRAGLWTCMVLTGISSLGDARAARERRRPHWVIPSIVQLPRLVRALEGGKREPFDWLGGEAP
jgi:phosphoglycolate/pyridoxal phosphate phosphatase family enzyme